MRRLGVAAITLVGVAVVIFACNPLGLGGGGVDGPVIRSGFSFVADSEDAEVRGVLSLDGDCLYIEHPDIAGIRYPVVWPSGTEWQEEAPGVVLTGGEVALLGTEVYGGGGYHSDRSRVESVAGSEGAGLAIRCAEDPHREVAIFNPGSRVDSLD